MRRVIPLAVSIVAGITGGNCVVSAQGTGITPEIRQTDIRLDKPVTVLASHTTLKELLQTLSTQTGVEIVLAPSPRLATPAPLLGVGADPKDPPLLLSPIVVAPPDTEFCALLQNKPLGDVLDALYSMMSYQGARWTWEQSKTERSYRYMLRPSRSLGNVVDAARLDIQRDFEARAAKMQSTLKLSPEKLAEAAKTDTEAAMLLSDDSTPASDGRQGLELFYSLPETQRRQILQGQTLVLPVDSLGEKGKAFADARMRNITPPLPAGTRQTIKFSAGSNESYVSPSVFIAPNNAGSINYLGSTFTAALWRDRLAYTRWHLKDDTLDPASLMNRTLVAPAKPLPPFAHAPSDIDPSQIPVPLSLATPWLWQTVHAAPVSLLAVLPIKRQYINVEPGRRIRINSNTAYGDPGSVALQQPVYGRTLGNTLKTLHDASATGWDHKWRGDILLLRDATAPFRIPPIPE